MEFDVYKCSVINLGRENQHSMYTLRNLLTESDTEKELEVAVSSNLSLERNMWKLPIGEIRVLKFIAMGVKKQKRKGYS